MRTISILPNERIADSIPVGQNLEVTGSSLVEIDGVGKFIVSTSQTFGPYSKIVTVRISAFAQTTVVFSDSVYIDGPTGSNIPAMLATVNGSTVLLGPDGLAPAGLVANVIPRTGTLTSLLTTVAGGVNEISYATDWDAAVKHNGVVGGAKVLYCKPKAAKLELGVIYDFANNSMARITLGAVSYDPHSLCDTVNSVVNVPTGATHFRVHGCVGFAANTTGRRAIRVGRNSTITAPATLTFNTYAQVPIPDVATVVYIQTDKVALESGTTNLTLNAFQNSGAVLSTSINTHFAVEFWQES